MFLLPPSPCPQRSARELCDRHLEQQLRGTLHELSTFALRSGLAGVPLSQLREDAARFSSVDFRTLYGFYKPTEEEGPIATLLWLDEEFLSWLWGYGVELSAEAARRQPSEFRYQTMGVIVRRFGRMARRRGFTLGGEFAGCRLTDRWPRAHVLSSEGGFHAAVRSYLHERHDSWEADGGRMWCRPVGWTRTGRPRWA